MNRVRDDTTFTAVGAVAWSGSENNILGSTVDANGMDYVGRFVKSIATVSDGDWDVFIATETAQDFCLSHSGCAGSTLVLASSRTFTIIYCNIIIINFNKLTFVCAVLIVANIVFYSDTIKQPKFKANLKLF